MAKDKELSDKKLKHELYIAAVIEGVAMRLLEFGECEVDNGPPPRAHGPRQAHGRLRHGGPPFGYGEPLPLPHLHWSLNAGVAPKMAPPLAQHFRSRIPSEG